MTQTLSCTTLLAQDHAKAIDFFTRAMRFMRRVDEDPAVHCREPSHNIAP